MRRIQAVISFSERSFGAPDSRRARPRHTGRHFDGWLTCQEGAQRARIGACNSIGAQGRVESHAGSRFPDIGAVGAARPTVGPTWADIGRRAVAVDLPMPIRKKPIRVPVKWEDDQWRAVLGNIGEIKPGAVAELCIDRNEFLDQARANRWAAKRTVVALPPGTELRVALTVHTVLNEPLKSLLLDPSATPPGYVSDIGSDTRFVPIRILGPTEAQRAKGQSGGLWLCLEGSDAKRIESGPVGLPVPFGESPVETLNQAFTRLSELFEPWRKSHTGNIYDHIYYLESNGLWYPLDDLRSFGHENTDRQLRTWLWNAVGAQLELPLLAAKKAHK